MICVQSGQNSSGKRYVVVFSFAANILPYRTFLQLLGKVLLPTEGLIYVPENLNAIYVSGEPLLLNMSLMENLRFGNTKEHPEEEIWALCKLVGLGEELLYKPNLEVGENGSKLSMSNRIYICLARALLSSVDILLLSNTLDMLSPTEGMRFLKMLREWNRAGGMSCLGADNQEEGWSQLHG